MTEKRSCSRHKNKEGNIVPGVTSVLGVLAKPALITWANKLGLRGIGVNEYVDDKASIGKLAHYLVLCHLKNEQPDISDYSTNQVEQAKNCILSFYEWEKSHPIEPILLETPLISERHQFGGVPDICCNLNGEEVVIDIKTGKGIFPEFFYQLAAYRLLLEEHGYLIAKGIILKVGRDRTETFEAREIMDFRLYEQMFLRCLEVYQLKQQIEERMAK